MEAHQTAHRPTAGEQILPEAQLDFWTDRHELDERTKHIDDEVVALVTAVVPDRAAQQAGRHADPDRPHDVHSRHRAVAGMAEPESC
ncbi:MAG TPA: hypothetical protein VMM93_10955 [Vicinamibacterales bacterium]|nr:hypothetical protein [Vicinamibacterales bacterium]